MFESLKARADQLKTETFALYLAARHPETPRLARILLMAIAAYALSPIDLIPDFVPVLGYVDDLVLLPLVMGLAIRLVPPQVMAECRLRAGDIMISSKSAGRIAGAIIIAVWIAIIILIGAWFIHS